MGKGFKFSSSAARPANPSQDGENIGFNPAFNIHSRLADHQNEISFRNKRCGQEKTAGKNNDTKQPLHGALLPVIPPSLERHTSSVLV